MMDFQRWLHEDEAATKQPAKVGHTGRQGHGQHGGLQSRSICGGADGDEWSTSWLACGCLLLVMNQVGSVSEASLLFVDSMFKTLVMKHNTLMAKGDVRR